jgi:hypothetical protein
VEPLAYYGIFRGQKEIDGGKHGLGFISTIAARKFSEERLKDELNSGSFGIGLDGWTFLDSSKVWVINGWSGMTYVRGNHTRMISLQRSSAHYFQRPDAGHVHVDSATTHVQGFAGRVALNKQKGSFYVNAALGFISPGFDANDMGFMFRTDIINGHAVLGYRWREPNTVTRQISLNLSTFRSHDFDGNLIWWGYWNSAYVQFLNYYSVEWFCAYNPESMNNRRTRGGPLTLNPSGYELGVFLYSDDRKDWIFNIGGNLSNYGYESERWRNVNAGIECKPATNVSVKISPSISWYRTAAQWITNVDDATATNTFGVRHLFAHLDQREVSASIRLNWTFTPKLSLQMYVQPLISVGEYTQIKELARPRTYAFATYGEGASTITRSGSEYTIDPDGVGPAPAFSVSDPNFNFKSLRGSAVLRWEYMPGSTMYLVWTQQRIDESDPGEFRFGRDFRSLFRTQPDNIFLIKLSYWANP